MKAVEWAAKFSAASTDEEKVLVWDEFGKETAALIAQRTKFTKDDLQQKIATGEGAVREQRQKFRSFSERLGLTDEQFSQMLDKSCVDFRAWQAAKAKAEEAIRKAEEEREKREKESRDGRTFAGPGRRHAKPNDQKRDNRHQKPRPRPKADDGKPVRLGEVPADWVA